MTNNQKVKISQIDKNLSLNMLPNFSFSAIKVDAEITEVKYIQ